MPLYIDWEELSQHEAPPCDLTGELVDDCPCVDYDADDEMDQSLGIERDEARG